MRISIIANLKFEIEGSIRQPADCSHFRRRRIQLNADLLVIYFVGHFLAEVLGSNGEISLVWASRCREILKTTECRGFSQWLLTPRVT
jgi:hypothetical protein